MHGTSFSFWIVWYTFCRFRQLLFGSTELSPNDHCKVFLQSRAIAILAANFGIVENPHNAPAGIRIDFLPIFTHQNGVWFALILVVVESVLDVTYQFEVYGCLSEPPQRECWRCRPVQFGSESRLLNPRVRRTSHQCIALESHALVH